MRKKQAQWISLNPFTQGRKHSHKAGNSDSASNVLRFVQCVNDNLD